MFGYFRFNSDYATYSMKRTYKNYYCGLCFALEKHYGQLPRMLLSYDILIIALAAKLNVDHSEKPLPCFGKYTAKRIYNDEGWKRTAAANILLFNGKIDDDINDENSVKAKLAGKVFKSQIKQASSDYPEMARIIDSGYRKMYEYEQKHSNIIEICDIFSDMMCELLVTFYPDAIRYNEFLRTISGWLYFIDQLDDYDDDVLEGKYNPLVLEGISKSEYVNSHHNFLKDSLKVILKDLDTTKSSLPKETDEEKILFSILNETIPAVTVRVINNQKLPDMIHRNKKTMEWNENQ